jgi:undecaprenyl diphosphate synthase
VLKQIDKTIDMSRNNTGPRLCLAINYGARTELVDAVQAIGRKVRDGQLDPDEISEEVLSDHLYTAGMPEPDLLIRTAGEMRLSNFLLWQISYAEVWVTEKTWPEFDEALLRQAVRDYANRTRRFGGLEA